MQERPTQPTLTPIPSPSVEANRQPLLARYWRMGLVAIPIAAIVAYPFSPSLANDFVAWDDDLNFLENPYFRGLGPSQLRWAWRTTLLGVYQPLAWLLFELQYVNCQLDPRGYHFTSLFLHVACAVVLYVLTVALLARCRTDFCLESPWTCYLSAGLATTLFAVHPLRVEAVAWASCQPYLPSILFSMLSVLAYLRAFPQDSAPRWGWLVASFFLFVAALLFKAVAVSLPAVLLILDVYPLRRFEDASARRFGWSATRALLEKVPFVMASAVFVGVTIAVREQSPFGTEHFDATAGIAQACYAVWFYILKVVLPVNLVMYYPVPKPPNWIAFPYGVSILATLAVSAGAFLLRRRWPGLLTAWLVYLVILAPNSGVISTDGFMIGADRYSYMATLSSVIVAAACFCWLWRQLSRMRPAVTGVLTIGLAAVVLLILVEMTRSQCRVWRNSDALLDHALTHAANATQIAPHLGLPHFNWATLLYNQGKYEAAEAHLTDALRLRPDLAPLVALAHYNLGTIRYTQGNNDAAVAHFTEALRLRPDYDKAHNNLGNVLFTQGKYEAAASHYADAIRLNPDYADAHKNLGLVLFQRGKYEEAATHFTEALRLHPGYADAHNYLGMMLSRQSKYLEAKVHFAHASRLDPVNVQAHYNLGLVYSRLSNYAAAKDQFAEAIRLKPDDPKAYNANALLLAACPEANLRDGKRAVEMATRACALTHWNNPSILDTLAAAQAESGDFDAALKSQARAIELLSDQRQLDEYRARLVLYQTKRPYRQVSPQRATPQPHP